MMIIRKQIGEKRKLGKEEDLDKWKKEQSNE